MSRILVAWERGANLGHLARAELLARALREAGHEILFAVKDTALAAGWLAPRGHAFVQAPGEARRTREAPLASYAEILLAGGWGEAASLHGQVAGWLALFRLYRAELLLADYAPTALLAAKVAGLRCVELGSGFDLPPLASPLPSIRPWEAIPPERLLEADRRALDGANRVLAMHDGAPLARLCDLFSAHARIHAMFEELDHYGPRAEVDYLGTIFRAGEHARVAWPEAGRGKVFAYLRPGVPAFAAIMAALRDCEAGVVCVVPGADAAARACATPRLRIHEAPVDLPSLAAQADLCVTYGSHATMATFLLAGVPLLMLPRDVEQLLVCGKAQALGAGKVLPGRAGRDEAAAALAEVMGEPACRAAARSFAARYSSFRPEGAVRKAALVVQREVESTGA